MDDGGYRRDERMGYRNDFIAWPDSGAEQCEQQCVIAASVAGEMFHALKAPIGRICLPDVPAPTSALLEQAYYIGAEDIVSAVEKVLVSST